MRFLILASLLFIFSDSNSQEKISSESTVELSFVLSDSLVFKVDGYLPSYWRKDKVPWSGTLYSDDSNFYYLDNTAKVIYEYDTKGTFQRFIDLEPYKLKSWKSISKKSGRLMDATALILTQDYFIIYDSYLGLHFYSRH